jgi:hypothetical protein
MVRVISTGPVGTCAVIRDGGAKPFMGPSLLFS